MERRHFCCYDHSDGVGISLLFGVVFSGIEMAFVEVTVGLLASRPHE